MAASSSTASMRLWLRGAGLEHLFDRLQQHQISDDNFAQLVFSDYDACQISDAVSRQKLFRLVQIVKRDPAAARRAGEAATNATDSSATANSSTASTNSASTAASSIPTKNNNSTAQQQSLQQQSSQQQQPSSIPAPSSTQQSASKLIKPSASQFSANTRIAASKYSSLPSALPSSTVTAVAPTSPELLKHHASSKSGDTSPGLLDFDEDLDAAKSNNNSSGSSSGGIAVSGQKIKSSLGKASFHELALVSQPPHHALSHHASSQVTRVDDDDDDDDAIGGGASGAAPIGAGLAADQFSDVSKIRVVVRKRPINSKEKAKGEVDVAVASQHDKTVCIHEPKQKVDLTKYVESHQFVFDTVFDEQSTNEEIYNDCCKPLISFFLNRGKATCFAYGQTGSGKTFTMMGPEGQSTAQGNSGLYVLAAHDIFKAIQSGSVPGADASSSSNATESFADIEIFVSFFEIYGGKLFDLGNDRSRLVCREDGKKNVQVVGLEEKKCSSVEELLALIQHGNTVRSTGSTDANVDSSRSHAILQITAKRPMPPDPKSLNKQVTLKACGKISFIDLAGSERAQDTTNNDRRTRLEGAEINKSLLALKECIRALDQGGKHLPFRGSVLTQVLKDSFGRNSRTVMIANISPNSGSCENTLNTLRYGDRVKELKKGAAKGQASANAAAEDAYMPHASKRTNVSTVAGELPANFDAVAIQQQQNLLSSAAALKSKNVTPTPVKQHKFSATPNRSGVASLKLQDEESSLDVPQTLADDSEEDVLAQTHSDLQSLIMSEEHSVFSTHRDQINICLKLSRQDLTLSKQYENEEISVDQFCEQGLALLQEKVGAIQKSLQQMQALQQSLQQEKELTDKRNSNKQHRAKQGGKSRTERDRSERETVTQR